VSALAILTVPPRPDDESGPEVKKFLARRGQLLMKEFREFGTITSEWGTKIGVSGAVISLGKLPAAITKFGVRLEQTSFDPHDEALAFIDYDELEEFLDAFTFLSTVARKFIEMNCDYTEVSYSTKDDVTIGFLQKEKAPATISASQQPFFRIGSHTFAFLSFEKLDQLKSAIALPRRTSNGGVPVADDFERRSKANGCKGPLRRAIEYA
jgi:hypothetical protein